MFKLFFRSVSVISFFLFFAGCASNTISSVPDIDVDKVTKPKFEMLKDRSLALTLIDERAEKYRTDSEQWHLKITSALREIFSKSGITLDEKSKNHLTLKVKDTALAGGDARDCVEVVSILKSEVYTFEISGTGCFSYQSNGGVRLDSDIERGIRNGFEPGFWGH